MLNVGLTGNVAAGKSTVAALFRDWGATVIEADRLVHELQQPGEPVFDAIVAHFGPTVVAADGTLDRDTLRTRVLADPAERRALEGLVHPAVAERRAQLVAEARARGDAIVVSDIPLLFEALDPSTFDVIVLVAAPDDVRRARLLARGLPPAEADRLMAAQMPSDAKRARSDFVIENDATRDVLTARTRAVWEQLVGRA